MAHSTGGKTGAGVSIAAALALGLGIPPAARADTQIGSAAQVVNSVTGTLASTRQTQTLRAGIDVFQNETITTAYASASRVIFADQTQLSIGPSSQVALDRFVFDPNPAASKVAVSIAKGVARFSTGLLPKPDYEVSTPACTIGVRGTVFTTIVSEARDSWVTVEEGQTAVSAQGVTVTVNAGQTTYVAFGRPPTPPSTSTAAPAITTQMDALLFNAQPRPPAPPPGGTSPPQPGGYNPYEPPAGYVPTGGPYEPGFGGPSFGGGFGFGIGIGGGRGGYGGGGFGGGGYSGGGQRGGGGSSGGGYGGNTGAGGVGRGR
ncbi:MAG TPA: FecR family protein [Stellaceae bacterium]|nr:FecR family protein [Stellaceae bacterium]